jgi:opacity protein-like surface antigen
VKIKYLMLGLLSTFTSFQVYSAKLITKKWNDFFVHPIFTVSGGPGWITPGVTQDIYLSPDYDNGYINTSKQQPVGFGEINFSLQQDIHPKISNQFGIAFSGAWMAKVNGQVWQYNDPLFYNYVYSYNVNSLRLALRDKIIFDQGIGSQMIRPYITGSVGIAWNHSYSYIQSPLSTDIPVTPAFSDRTQNAFTYSAGAGLQTQTWNNLVFAVGYEFIDWGGSALAAAPGQSINSGLSMSHLYMNTLLFSISYTV